MKGYYDDIEETSYRIKDGWYDTGDMGIIDKDGFIWHRGRLKRFVKIGGEMVSLVKTESVLETLLPDGVSCCVVEIPDPQKGTRLIAAVTQKVDIVFDELPKMGSGKLDFRTITDMVRKKLTK